MYCKRESSSLQTRPKSQKARAWEGRPKSNIYLSTYNVMNDLENAVGGGVLTRRMNKERKKEGKKVPEKKDRRNERSNESLKRKLNSFFTFLLPLVFFLDLICVIWTFCSMVIRLKYR